MIPRRAPLKSFKASAGDSSPAASPLASPTPAVVHLPESTAGAWPGPVDYRPPGWRTTLSPLEVRARLDEIESHRGGAGWSDARTIRERKQLEEHIELLRQCWATQLKVWRLAEAIVGPPEVDPFANRYGHIHEAWAGVRLLDGNQGRNGFDLSLWGRVAATATEPERGRTGYLNGPHGDTTAYVELATCAHAAGHRVAVVVALDGSKWFAGGTRFGEPDPDDIACAVRADVLSCDILAVPETGRMAFEPPPGVRKSSPSKGYGVAMWGVTADVVAAIWPDGFHEAKRVSFGGDTWTLLRGCSDAGRGVTAVSLESLLGQSHEQTGD